VRAEYTSVAPALTDDPDVDLLLRTRRSAAEIGEAVGYRSEAAFGKVFAQSIGVTPGCYRRHSQADDASET